MSATRCPRCGGLVGPDATFCGQCLAPLGERPRPAPPRAEEPAGAPRGTEGPVFRAEGERLTWTCLACDQANPLDAQACARCGTPFRALFDETPARRVDPDRAARLSLLFPGAGHIAAGRVAEGVARAVVFGWTLLTALAIVIVRRGHGPGPFLPLLLVYFGAAAFVYGVSVPDARRAAEGRPQVLSSRLLLYGVAGLMVLAVVVLVVSAFRAARM